MVAQFFGLAGENRKYAIPIMFIMKAFIGASDRAIFEHVTMQDHTNTFLTDRVELLPRSFKMHSIYAGEQCLEYLGDMLRVVLGLPEDWNNRVIGVWLIPISPWFTSKNQRDKFGTLVYIGARFGSGWPPTDGMSQRFMLRKLYSLLSGSSCAENPDLPQHQEVLLCCMIIKERLEEALNQVRYQIATDVRRAEPPPDFFNVGHSDEARELPPNMLFSDFEKDGIRKFLSCDHSISTLP